MKRILSAATCLLGCTSGSTTPNAPPVISQTIPAANATGVDIGEAVRVQFTGALDSTSVTSSTVQIADSAPLPVRVWYSKPDHVVHVSGPFGPNRTYHATIEPGLRSATHDSLGTAYAWSFSTRALQTVQIDTFDASYDALVLDHTMGVHAVYLAPSRGYLRYAECHSACTLPGSWDSTRVDIIGGDLYGSTVGLAIDGTDRLHIVYYSRATSQLKYATCSTLCSSSANWTTAVIDTSMFAMAVAAYRRNRGPPRQLHQRGPALCDLRDRLHIAGKLADRYRRRRSGSGRLQFAHRRSHGTHFRFVLR